VKRYLLFSPRFTRGYLSLSPLGLHRVGDKYFFKNTEGVKSISVVLDLEKEKMLCTIIIYAELVFRCSQLLIFYLKF
jgi:hypothetical protein